MDLTRAALAEALGVFFLVLVGCGAIAVDATTGGLGHVGVSLAFGLVVLALVYALGPVSGAHLNPAITVAFALTRHFPSRRVAAYVAAQLAGAVAGALAVRALVGGAADAGATRLAVAPLAGFAVEALATFLLAFVIVAVAKGKNAPRAATGLAIGLAVGVDALVFGPLTGASMNPARSLGPALVAGAWTDAWVYVLAPLAGACLGMVAYEALRGAPAATVPDAEEELA